MSSDDGEYKVGYKKPPKEHQVKPGVVLNPNGRAGKAGKRRNRTLGQRVGEILYEALTGKVDAVVNGRKVRMSKLEAMVHRAVNDATKNGSKDMKEVFQLLRDFPLVLNKLEREIDPAITEHGRLTMETPLAGKVSDATWADFMYAFDRKEIPPEHIPILQEYFLPEPRGPNNYKYYIKLPEKKSLLSPGRKRTP